MKGFHRMPDLTFNIVNYIVTFVESLGCVSVLCSLNALIESE